MESLQTQNRKIALTLTSILILAFGIVLIICNKQITGQGIIVVAGILFLLTGIVNIIMYCFRPRRNSENSAGGPSALVGWFVSIAAIILGICMLISVETFTALIPVIFGILIFLGVILLSLSFLIGSKAFVKNHRWFWFAPLIMLILGIVTILQKAVQSDPLIMILTGSAMIIFGLSACIAWNQTSEKNVVKTEENDETDTAASAASTDENTSEDGNKADKGI